MAVDGVSLEIAPGDRLALVGENGAGKSSLMNVLYGLYQPDRGTISADGRPVRLRSPKDAIALGIGMVHQHFMLVPSLTVAENVVLGREPTRRGLLDLDRACAEVEQTCRRFGFGLEVRTRIESLTVGSQQKVEIVKALHRGAKTLILDEPTAVLTPQESDELFKVARELSSAGHAVVLISHKLKEVLSFATRVAVMRRGKKVAEVPAEKTTPEELAALTVGSELSRETNGARGPKKPGAPVLELERATCRTADGRKALLEVTLSVREGEVVGIAGVDGNGQQELAELVTGLRPLEGGKLRLCAEEVRRLDPSLARRMGVAHVPEDRLLWAVVGPMSVEENISLGRQHLPPFSHGGLVDSRGRRQRACSLIRDFDIRPPDPQAALSRLSGGNQQKVVVSRELDCAPRLLVVVQPTRGLDVASVALVHRRLAKERERGCGVLLVSLDLDEVLALSDRIYVLYGGRVTGELERASFDERRIGRLMLGAEEATFA
ncbi:MAG: ABC transporter ATP-binding protein [Myxococcales bacterium]|nr:ABC transporter ATP-binding protein [Myxococcales bacterium]